MPPRGIADDRERGLGGARRHDVVALGHRDEHLSPHAAEVDDAVADADPAAHEGVLAHEQLRDLAERGAGERHVVARPLRHRLEALDELIVPEVLEQRRLLGDLRRRGEHVEAAVERFRGDVAGGVDEVLGAQPALA